MKTDFDRYWECKGDEWFSRGINKEHAKLIFESGQDIMISKIIMKASEFFTRSSTHPAAAILEALNYAGVTDDELIKRLSLKFKRSVFDTMKEDIDKQFEEAFPELSKKLKT